MSYHEIETTILGGLPVTIGFTVDPAEPDIGISEPYVSDWDVVALKSKPIRPRSALALALYNRVYKSGEIEYLFEKLIEGVE